VRNLIVSEMVTLDGVMGDPGGSEKTVYGGWSLRFRPSADQLDFKVQELFASDALLLGRVTYQGFAAAWPRAPPDARGYSGRMNGMQKYVVSSSLSRLDWNNSSLIKGKIAEEVGKLKLQPGADILIFGSARLVDYLLHEGLVDEVRMLVYPVVSGAGKRFFNNGLTSKLLLVEARAFESGVALLRYKTSR
jgi:dihydrofolate reductase